MNIQEAQSILGKLCIGPDSDFYMLSCDQFDGLLSEARDSGAIDLSPDGVAQFHEVLQATQHKRK